MASALAPLLWSLAASYALVWTSWALLQRSCDKFAHAQYDAVARLELASLVLDVCAYVLLLPIAMTASASPLAARAATALSWCVTEARRVAASVSHSRGVVVPPLFATHGASTVMATSACDLTKSGSLGSMTLRSSASSCSGSVVCRDLCRDKPSDNDDENATKAARGDDDDDACLVATMTVRVTAHGVVHRLGLRRRGAAALLLLSPLAREALALAWQTALSVVLVSACHVLVHLHIDDRHVLTMQMVMNGVRCFVDGVVLCAATLVAAVVVCRAKAHVLAPALFVPPYAAYVRAAKRVVVWLLALCLACLCARLYVHVHRVDALQHLRRGILSDDVDACAAEGLRMTPALRRAWVWPAYIARTSTLLGVNDSCTAPGWRGVSYVDGTTSTLVVSSVCPGGRGDTAPRVFVEWPNMNMLGASSPHVMPVAATARPAYQRELEQLYAAADDDDPALRVHRDAARGGIVTAVEVHPRALRAVARRARSVDEYVARASWPSPRVYEVPLGRSAQYTVYCNTTGVREVHLYPLNASYDVAPPLTTTTTPPTTASTTTTSTSQEPLANVLILLFDAVSRQEVTRSLPRFTAWLRRFQREQQEKPHAEQHTLYEPQAFTTIGYNTAAAVPSLLTGTSQVTLKVSEEQWYGMHMERRTLFSAVKQAHGDAVNVALTYATCDDIFTELFTRNLSNAGRGGRGPDVDHYLFQPFCDVDYGYLLGQWQGPYSIVRRCMGATQVHEHVLNYTTHMLRRQMRQRAEALLQRREQQQAPFDANATTSAHASRGTHFVNLAYFYEGHEGMHSVLSLVDESLTLFMDVLRHELRFFDDPHNVLLFTSDHGNHMGHYKEFSLAGDFEQTTPAMLYIMHRSVFARVDARKGRAPGTSEATFAARLRRLVTPTDVHMTVSELLGVAPGNYSAQEGLALTYASLFDKRANDSYVQQCSQYRNSGDEACLMLYCAPPY